MTHPRDELGLGAEAPAAGGRRLKIDLAYDGTDFHGWQRQAGLRTVQGEFMAAVARLLEREAAVAAAGRTDAGVHARGQVCSLAVRDAGEQERLGQRLPRLVPPDLQVLAVSRVSWAFNARFAAVSRRYSYHWRLKPDVFGARWAAPLPGRVDRAAMDEAAALARGAHDFTSFAKAGAVSGDRRGLCVVDLCRFEWSAAEAILHVRADRFLHNMVRVLAGTLVEVGLGRRSPQDVPVILDARDRRRAGRTMPPRGLFLEEVGYPAELLDPHHRGPLPGRAPSREET